MPQNQTYWWTVTSDAEAASAARDITEALVAYGLPILAQLTTTADLEAAWSDRLLEVGWQTTAYPRTVYLRLLATESPATAPGWSPPIDADPYQTNTAV
jgi:hypothetical protein